MPEVTVNGRPVQVAEGASVVAALWVAGHRDSARSLTRQPRGALCGMGSCQECRVRVDGAWVLGCLTVCEQGQAILTGEQDG